LLLSEHGGRWCRRFVAACWIGMSEKQSFLSIRPIHVLSRLWYAVNLLNNDCTISSPSKNVPCQIYANMQSRPISAYFCRIFCDYMVCIFFKKCPCFSDMPSWLVVDIKYGARANSVKLFEFGIRMPGVLFLDVWYAGGIDFRHFRTLSLQIFGIILGLLETTKRYKLL